MIKYQDITKSVAEQAEETAKIVRERMVEGLEAVDPMADQVASMLPTYEAPKLPLLEALPSFTDVVEANTALAERLLKVNKDLLLAVAKAVPTLEREAVKA
jgi:hypothetical protein